MFPCSSCGLCCQNMGDIPELKSFDLGNGICKHLNVANNSCNIYETRPNICRIDEMYKIKYSKFFTKNEFYMENAKVCNILQEKYKLDDSFRIKIGE